MAAANLKKNRARLQGRGMEMKVGFGTGAGSGADVTVTGLTTKSQIVGALNIRASEGTGVPLIADLMANISAGYPTANTIRFGVATNSPVNSQVLLIWLEPGK